MTMKFRKYTAAASVAATLLSGMALAAPAEAATIHSVGAGGLTFRECQSRLDVLARDLRSQGIYKSTGKCTRDQAKGMAYYYYGRVYYYAHR